MLLGALVAVCIGGCGGGSEGCPAQEKSARPDRVPAGQAWLLGVGVDGRRSTVYAMTSRGLFASHDQGRSWRRLGAGGQVVGFDASRPRHLLATGRHGLSVSFDAGDTWLRAGLPDCVAPLDGAAFARSRGLVYGWASGPLLAHDPYRAAVVLSRDGGRSFAKIASYDTTSLAVAEDARVAYAATSRGLFVTRTAGADWHRLAAAPEELREIAVVPESPSTLFATAQTGRQVDSIEGEGGTTERLYRSLDAGDSWRSVLELFDIASVRSTPGNPATLYLGGERIVARHARTVVLRSDDHGAHWRTLSSVPSDDLPTVADISAPSSIDAGDVIADPAHRGVIYRDTGARVQRSLDGGRSFAPLRVRAR